MQRVTQILKRLDEGDGRATVELLPLVYDELRRLAARELDRERPGQTLQPTALVHEAFLKLIDRNDPAAWNHRGHFFAAAAEAMRRILIDQARRKKAARHGGEHQRVELDLHELAEPSLRHDLLALDAALLKLEAVDGRKAELVKLRYFAGLTMAQAAEALGISSATAERDWAYARVWLLRELTTAG